LTVTLI